MAGEHNSEYKTYHFKSAFVGGYGADGAWAENVRMQVGDDGLITELQADTKALSGDISFSGHAIPGMANAHSHAFQRAFAGLAEHRQEGVEDSFWSWRQAMYKFVAKLTPDDVAAISAQVYVEMLKAGYTSVAEFHYLHNDKDGKTYAEPDIMSKAIIEGAKQAGIGLNLVPILYQQAGFDGAELNAHQKRFYLSNDDYLKLYDGLDCQKSIGFHSLRAVSIENITEVYSIKKGANTHIHIAEQEAEVADCVAHTGVRPIEYLYDSLDVNNTWCLVHATHANEGEVALMAASKAVVCLCPSTEANLGDGIFPIQQFLAAGGRFAIGSDSHVTVNPMEELRNLEYTERLFSQKRIVLGDGNSLWHMSQGGGAQVMEQKVGIQVGARADILVIDNEQASYFDKSASQILGSMIFTSYETPVSHVISGGEVVVDQFKQKNEESILTNYKKTILPYMESN